LKNLDYDTNETTIKPGALFAACLLHYVTQSNAIFFVEIRIKDRTANPLKAPKRDQSIAANAFIFFGGFFLILGQKI
jgi:hypothetical protein